MTDQRSTVDPTADEVEVRAATPDPAAFQAAELTPEPSADVAETVATAAPPAPTPDNPLYVYVPYAPGEITRRWQDDFQSVDPEAPGHWWHLDAMGAVEEAPMRHDGHSALVRVKFVGRAIKAARQAAKTDSISRGVQPLLSEEEGARQWELLPHNGPTYVRRKPIEEEPEPLVAVDTEPADTAAAEPATLTEGGEPTTTVADGDTESTDPAGRSPI